MKGFHRNITSSHDCTAYFFTPWSHQQCLCAKWYTASSGYVCNKRSKFTFYYHFCQTVYAYRLTHMFDKSNICTTPNALQLPLQRNAARQTQPFVGNECNSGVPKCNNAVSVFEAQRAPCLMLCSGLWRAASCSFSPQKLDSNGTKIPICQIV